MRECIQQVNAPIVTAKRQAGPVRAERDRMGIGFVPLKDDQFFGT